MSENAGAVAEMQLKVLIGPFFLRISLLFPIAPIVVTVKLCQYQENYITT